MALFYVSVKHKSKENNSKVVWKNSIIADNVNEAYLIGKAQFKLEMPDLTLENYTIEASGTQVEKQGL